MEISSNDKFCSLDMLAEVASATLYSDPSLIPSEQYRSNTRVGGSPRKSVNSFEKLTLEQIKNLSEKNLIEMFSEPLCDEMKKNYSFQCFLIPEKCSQTFKSFGNETRARNKMKMHLLSHIRDLVAINNHEMFMAEPLHARKKRLKEINRKSIRKKKKKNKQLYNKMKKDDEYSPTNFEEIEFLNEDHKNYGKIESTNFNSTCESDYEFLNAGLTNGVSENSSNDYDSAFDTFNSLSSAPSYGPKQLNCKQAVLEGHKNVSNFDGSFLKSSVKKKKKLNTQGKTRKKNSDSRISLFQEPSSYDIESNFHLYCDAHSESDLPIHHDHTYTSVNGKTFNCDSSSGGESNKSGNKYRDPLNPKKTTHRCFKKESPLIIPTPPFPYVYIPLLPHIAQIQEVGFTFRAVGCRCKNNDILEGLRDCNINPRNVPPSSSEENELAANSVCQISPENSILDLEDDENTPSDSYMRGVVPKDNSNGDSSDIKHPDTSFCIDDLLRPECPENLQAVEKKLALKCIRALRTKKKDERDSFTCQICKNKSFTAQATLMYHYRSHAGIKPFSCSLCEATFTRQHSLNYHMLIHNNESRFVCSDCGRNFRHPGHYKEHLRRHTGETPYECTDCNIR